MFLRSYDLFLVVAIIGCSLVAATLGDPNPGVWSAAYLPLVFAAPGYALAAALFDGGNEGLLEQLALSLGLSFAVAILGGSVLDQTEWGLTRSSWLVLLSTVALMSSCVALWKRWKRRKVVGNVVASSRQSPPLTVQQGLLFAVALVLVVCAIVLSRWSAAVQDHPGFTQLWILPYSSGIDDRVRVGLLNHESASEDYSLQVTEDGRLLGNWPMIGLGPGEKWEAELALSKGGQGAETVEADLRRLEFPSEIYRTVQLRRTAQE